MWREHTTLTDTDRRRRADDRIENVNIKWGGQPEEREVATLPYPTLPYLTLHLHPHPCPPPPSTAATTDGGGGDTMA